MTDENANAFPTVIVKRDGSTYMAAWGDFVNLQESNCDFGDTPQDAVWNFLKVQGLIDER